MAPITETNIPIRNIIRDYVYAHYVLKEMDNVYILTQEILRRIPLELAMEYVNQELNILKLLGIVEENYETWTRLK